MISTVIFDKVSGVIQQIMFDDATTPTRVPTTSDILKTDVFPADFRSIGPQHFRVINGVVVPAEDTTGLNDIKQKKFAIIDAKTDEIISRGFAFSGMQFSTSIEAQARGLALDQMRNDTNLQYPVVWNNIDDTDAIQLTNAEMVHNFVLSGIAYYRAAVDTGSALKLQVRQATTVAAVLAVTDTRT